MAMKRPSEVYNDFWIQQRHEKSTYPAPVEGRSGKWLIFLPKGDKLDSAWSQVVDLLHQGKLGRRAKVSTMRPNRNASNPNDGVICVYTYSLDDLEDARRIRQSLREIGITWKIPYKLDKDVGRYQNRGDTGLSKLHE